MSPAPEPGGSVRLFDMTEALRSAVRIGALSQDDAIGHLMGTTGVTRQMAADLMRGLLPPPDIMTEWQAARLRLEERISRVLRDGDYTLEGGTEDEQAFIRDALSEPRPKLMRAAMTMSFADGTEVTFEAYQPEQAEARVEPPPLEPDIMHGFGPADPVYLAVASRFGVIDVTLRIKSRENKIRHSRKDPPPMPTEAEFKRLRRERLEYTDSHGGWMSPELRAELARLREEDT